MWGGQVTIHQGSGQESTSSRSATSAATHAGQSRGPQ